MLLWLTRKYPPQVGGMEKFNFELTRELGNRLALHLVAHGGGQRSLPLYLGRVVQSAARLRARGTTVSGVHLGDALLVPVGLALAASFGDVPVSVSVHGLDLTYSSPPYQLMIRTCLKRFSRVMCNSQPTRREAIARGTATENCRVILPGATRGPHLVTASEEGRQMARIDLARHLAGQLDVTVADGPIILTVGRLVPRKGVAWFVRSVLPSLWSREPRLIHIVVGDGPDRREIVEASREARADNRVVLTGPVDQKLLPLFYAAADAFVMPNVPMTTDPEGFGIAALDASVAGLWVFAAAADGIPDAVADGRNGTLIPPGQADRWTHELDHSLREPVACRARGVRGREFTLQRYAWPSVADQYLAEFRALGVV